MSTYCSLEISASRETALEYQSRIWTDPARPSHAPAKPLEEFYGKNVLPLLWLPLFAPADLVRIVPPVGARFKFTPQHAPEPFHVLLSPANAALERLRRQSEKLFSLIDLSSPHPDLGNFTQIWEARLQRHADRWVLFEPGDVFGFVEGDELAALLKDTLRTVAADTADASAEAALRDMMGNPFAKPYGSTEVEVVHSWYHILAGSRDGDLGGAETSWPPEPTTADLVAAQLAAETAAAAKAAKEMPVAKKPAVKWWQRFLTRS